MYSGVSTLVATFTAESSGDYAGTSVAGDGDVDGDGTDDLWIGAYMESTAAEYAGAAYLILGPVSGTVSLASADAKILGVSTWSTLGRQIRLPGDIDADGYDDAYIAAPYDSTAADRAGLVYVVTQPASGSAPTVAAATFLGEDADDLLGEGSMGGGDFNGDGALDFVAGSESNSDSASSAGAVWLMHGPFAGSLSLGAAHAEWLGTNSSDRLGAEVDVIPDTDGDGTDEIAIGAQYGDEGALTDHGAVWIWLGDG